MRALFHTQLLTPLCPAPLQVKLAEQHLLQARRHHTSLVGDKGKLDDKIATLRLETDTANREVGGGGAGLEQ
jgi:hypothetical protein